MSKKILRPKTEYIRSSKVSIKFANSQKLIKVSKFLDEYSRVLGKFVDIFWDSTSDENDYIPTFIPKSLRDKITDSWLSARALDAAGKQAVGIVRLARRADVRRTNQIKTFIADKMFKKARKLQAIHDKKKMNRPKIESIPANLDSRFFSFDYEGTHGFDGWLNLKSLGFEYGSVIAIPFKRTSHLNSLMKKGIPFNAIVLSKQSITISYKIPMIENTNIETMGMDVGVTTLLSMYDGKNFHSTGVDVHGHDMDSILTKMGRKKKGSKAFIRAQRHRTNYVNRCVKNIPWDGLKMLKYERIRKLRGESRVTRKLTHFTYRELFSRIELTAEEKNVSTLEVNPTYTSQRCSCCGWTQKSNRSGKVFKCRQCSYKADADLNASRNIYLSLPWISKGDRQRHLNRNGFYWYADGQEPIVPVSPKVSHKDTTMSCCLKSRAVRKDLTSPTPITYIE